MIKYKAITILRTSRHPNRTARTRFCCSPEGTTLSQPRVERREGNERRATLGEECHPTSKPRRATPLSILEIVISYNVHFDQFLCHPEARPRYRLNLDDLR